MIFNSHSLSWLFDLKKNKTWAVGQRGAGFSSSETSRKIPPSCRQGIAADCNKFPIGSNVYCLLVLGTKVFNATSSPASGRGEVGEHGFQWHALIQLLPGRVTRTHTHRWPLPSPLFFQKKKESWNLSVCVGHGISVSGKWTPFFTRVVQMGCKEPHINQKVTSAPYLEG